MRTTPASDPSGPSRPDGPYWTFLFVIGLVWILGTAALYWTRLIVGFGSFGLEGQRSPADQQLLQALPAGMLACAIGAPALAVVVSAFGRRWGGAVAATVALVLGVLFTAQQRLI